MTICKFWRQGNCKFGDKCKFEHPANAAASQSNQNQYPSQNRGSQNQKHSQGGQNLTQSQNRFGALQNGLLGNHAVGFGSNQNSSGGQRAPQGRGPPSRDSRSAIDPTQAYGITRQTLEHDLRVERPQWIMSAYGPGKDAPRQLFGGFPLEQSFEEIRVQHYSALAAGAPAQQSAQLEQEAAALSNQQMQNVLNDLDGAIRYVVDGANEHPNRLDIVDETWRAVPRNQRGVFERSRARPSPQSYSFQNNLPQQGFGAASFGQPPQPQQTRGGFGQPPNIAQNAPFGAPTTFGNPPPNQDFGSFQQPQQPGFGVPSPQDTPPFSMNSNNGSAFPISSPQPPSQAISGIGQLPIQQSNGGFGQAPQQQQNRYGMSPQQGAPFGQPQVSSLKPFGQVAGMPQSNNNGQPFGAAPQTNAAPFGQSATPMVNGISQQSQQQQQSMSAPFGQQIQQQPNTDNTFGALAPNNTATNGFVNHPPQTTNFVQPQQLNDPPHLAPIGPISSYTTRDANNRLLTFKSQPVNYIDGQPCFRKSDGSWERIWFPDGPPAPVTQQNQYPRLVQLQQAPGVENAYAHFRHYGVFPEGLVPQLPPNVELGRWDI